MTKEKQAIEYIKKYRELDEELYNTAPKGTVSSIATHKCLEFWDMAIKALEQSSYNSIKTELNGDMISREDVEECKELMTDINGDTVYAVRMSDIRRLSPVNPQEPCEDAITRILKRMWNCRGKHTLH